MDAAIILLHLREECKQNPLYLLSNSCFAVNDFIVEVILKKRVFVCPALEASWKYVIAIISEISQNHIDCDHKIWILVDSVHFTWAITKAILFCLQAQKWILKNWKYETPPPPTNWINELVSYSTPERILYSVCIFRLWLYLGAFSWCTTFVRL